MEYAVYWLIFAFLIAGIASSRGRSDVGWFVLSIFISPLLAGILIAFMPKLPQR